MSLKQILKALWRRNTNNSLRPTYQPSAWTFPLYFVCGLLGCVAVATDTIAQDTVRYQVGTQAVVANRNYLPHWLSANRFGILNIDDNVAVLLDAQATASHYFTRRLSLSAGLAVVAKVGSQPSQVFVQQGYLKLRYGFLELSGGRVEEMIGFQDSILSSGSLSMSGNARPIPRVKIAIPEYTDVPFTRGYLQVKGGYAHGWLGEDRHITNAYLHEKSLYGKVGGKLPVNLYGGLIHFAVWGGETAGIRIPDSFRDYLQVVKGSSARIEGENDPLIGEGLNAAGDHLGIYDLGVSLSLKKTTLKLYQQTLFEDASGNNPFNGDRLLGLSVRAKNNSKIISGVLYEFINTKYQSGPGLTDPANGDWYDLEPNYGYPYGGRDNYYNNYLYKTGWTYQGRVIGTPLFYTQERMRLYDPEFIDPDSGFDFNIVNNRIVAHHFGITGSCQGRWSYKVLATFSKNYGTYGGLNGGITRWGSIENPDASYAFKPARNQRYFLVNVERSFSSKFMVYCSVGVDTGEIYKSGGLLAGIRWNAYTLINFKSSNQ